MVRRKKRVKAAGSPRATKTAGPAGGDAAVARKTGHGLAHWFGVLDRFDAVDKGHTAAAAHLRDDHAVPGWHAQMITVAYEQARGLRAKHQASSGRFEVSVSKSVRGTVADVAAALGQARRRTQWLRGAAAPLVRALDKALTGPAKREIAIKKEDYARLRYPWDGAAVEIYLHGKPNGRCTVVASSKGLPDAAAVRRRRAQWRGALERLGAYLAG